MTTNVSRVSSVAPYTHTFDKKLNSGRIKVVAPLNYLNGSLTAIIVYRIESGNYLSQCHIEMFTSHNQYIAEINGFSQRSNCQPITTVPNDEVHKVVTQLMDYIHFVGTMMESRDRNHPPSIEEYLRSRQ